MGGTVAHVRVATDEAKWGTKRAKHTCPYSISITNLTTHLLQITRSSLPSLFSIPSFNLHPTTFSSLLFSLTPNNQMAQKAEKNETEFKVPDTITPCSNPASIPEPSGFFDDKAASSAATSSRSPKRSLPPEDPTAQTDLTTLSEPKRAVNRCSGCRRRVGLTGFRCRCGDLFCAEHRYSDRHDCSYDYKAAGREAIARENPVVKAAKIVKV
ncbi:hypothetical protein VNO77_39493 [Canavalia gladiata]|uniref:AN1-type domain-containing protein n=1 Tax=Canavalia gladiata TaxID=3824 RepID=A0AAN9KC85_CANGL